MISDIIIPFKKS